MDQPFFLLGPIVRAGRFVECRSARYSCVRSKYRPFLLELYGTEVSCQLSLNCNKGKACGIAATRRLHL